MATSTFLTKWRGGSGRLSYLVELELPRVDGTQTDTLYAAVGDIATDSGVGVGVPARLWAGILKHVGPIHHPGGFANTDLGLCTSSATFNANAQVIFPAGVSAEIKTTLRDSVISHLWPDARATIWRYFHGLGSFDHAQCVLFNANVLEVELEGDALTISLRQAIPWNVPVAPRMIGRKEFPRAPDSAIGLPLPRCYGKTRWVPMRRPWPKAASSDYPTLARWYYTMTAGNAATGAYHRAVLVDTGRGGAGGTVNREARVAVAGHGVGGVSSESAGRSGWIETSAGLAMLDPEGTGYAEGVAVELFESADLEGYKLPAEKRYAMLALVPADIVQTSNMPDNGRQILDPSDTNYVLFDYAANKRTLHFTFPAVPEFLQTGAGHTLVIGYQSSSDFNGFNGYVSVNGGADTPLFGGGDIAPSAAPKILQGSSIAPVFNATYLWKLNFGAASPAGKARIFFIGLIMDFRPVEEVVQSERVVTTKEAMRYNNITGNRAIQPTYDLWKPPDRTPAVTELRGQFYSNFEGMQDDAAGNFSGSGFSVLEKPPDIIMHLLNAGGMSLNQLPRVFGDFGSFNAARFYLQVDGVHSVHAVSVSEATDMLSVIQMLTAESASQLSISPYDGNARLHVWRDSPAVDYPYLLGKEDIEQPGGPRVRYTPLTDIITDIRVAYRHDQRSGSYRSEVALGPDHSVGGHDWRTLRDQNLEVIEEVNDVFDFEWQAAGGGAWTGEAAVLDPGVYVPQSTLAPGAGDVADGFAQQVKDKAPFFQVTYGTQITTDYNDRLAYLRNGANDNAFLTAGTYASCEDLAAAVQAAVNADAGTVDKFLCGYDRREFKFWVMHNDGANTWKIDGSTNEADAIMQETAWASLGFCQASADITIPASPTKLYADDVRLEKHFALMSLVEESGFKLRYNLLFQSGFSGADSSTAPRSCAELLGFAPAEDKLADLSGSGGVSYCADGGKGILERLLATTAALYGRRRELSVRSRTIHDDHTARSLRNRLANLFRGPRAIIEFSTRSMPDVERGHVVGFREEMARKYPAWGTDGLWVGKRFQVIEVVHNNGPTSLSTQVVAVDMTTLPTSIVPVGQGLTLGNILMGET